MTKSFLHIILIIILIGIILVGAVTRLIFPPYYNIGKISPEVTLSEFELFRTFVADPIDAQNNYAQKAILIEGRVTAIDDKMILMGQGMEVVRIKLIKNWRYPVPEFKQGDRILVKGICRGIDLTEVLVTHAFIVNVR